MMDDKNRQRMKRYIVETVSHSKKKQHEDEIKNEKLSTIQRNRETV